MSNFLLSGAWTALTLQPGQTTVLKRNGIAEITSIFMSVGDPGFPFVPLQTPYPNANTGGFICDSFKKESLAGGWYRSTVVFVSIFNQPTSYVTYDTKVIQVPIDQSPDFISIAGTPTAPLNGAIFDANGQFIGFGPISNGILSPYCGVVSAFVQQDRQIVHGSSFQPAVPDPSLFCESLSNTLRGGVWEYEITYNLDISTTTGIVTPFN